MMILDNVGITVEELNLAECRVIHLLDHSILSGCTVFDFVTVLSENLKVTSSSLSNNFLSYITNLYLYILTTDGYEYDLTLVCLVSSVAFFVAKQEFGIIDRVYCVLKSLLTGNKNRIFNLQEYKEYVLSTLKALGSTSEELDIIDRQIDLSELSVYGCVKI